VQAKSSAARQLLQKHAHGHSHQLQLPIKSSLLIQRTPGLRSNLFRSLIDPVLQLSQPRLDVLAVAEGAALPAQEQAVEQLDVHKGEDLREQLPHQERRHLHKGQEEDSESGRIRISQDDHHRRVSEQVNTSAAVHSILIPAAQFLGQQVCRKCKELYPHGYQPPPALALTTSLRAAHPVSPHRVQQLAEAVDDAVPMAAERHGRR
jgi:hypothetical protein